MITLITGGIKSGKSAHALKLANQATSVAPQKGAFIATADPGDLSMKNKIAAHQKEREGSALVTIEEKINLAEMIEGLDSSYEVMIIDCLTLWMANLMYHFNDKKDRDDKIHFFLSVLEKLTIPCFIITNEVGSGVIPENKLARQYQDELGSLNHKVAQISRAVILMVSGIPVKIK
jgi:adenosylcobinamide kinase/adenosylcobinamide-phosphate guanylyltransferase